MAKLKRLTDKLEVLVSELHESYIFHCPGCNAGHSFRVGGNERPRWTFNGNVDKPTFHPSLRCNQDQCHLNIEDGMIKFHPDCVHALAGQTVEMVPLDKD